MPGSERAVGSDATDVVSPRLAFTDWTFPLYGSGAFSPPLPGADTVNIVAQGGSRTLSAVDLLICATAAQHDLVVLHDDEDFATAARFIPDVRERSIYDAPQVD